MSILSSNWFGPPCQAFGTSHGLAIDAAVDWIVARTRGCAGVAVAIEIADVFGGAKGKRVKKVRHAAVGGSYFNARAVVATRGKQLAPIEASYT
jgi:hypothetical protein